LSAWSATPPESPVPSTPVVDDPDEEDPDDEPDEERMVQLLAVIDYIAAEHVVPAQRM
jgi:hypothetical protein